MNWPPTSRPTSISFLLTQIGTHVASRFAARLASLDLLPQHAGVLRMLGQSSGIGQQELAAWLDMHASRLVGLVDTLEMRGLVERQSSATDRRVYALHLTEAGRDTLKQLGSIAVHTTTPCVMSYRQQRGRSCSTCWNGLHNGRACRTQCILATARWNSVKNHREARCLQTTSTV
jgi:DNA-binding MarR family transcriptional regulator